MPETPNTPQTTVPPARPPETDASAAPEPDEVVRLASSLVGRRDVRLRGTRYPSDCSGFVRGVYAEAAGVDLFASGARRRGENGVSIIHRTVRHQGGLHAERPSPGDLVFFHDTHDRNGDGRRNDPLTHIGIVETVLPDATVVLIHHSGGRVVRSRMNLAHPAARDRDGLRTNDYLRRGRGDRRLTGQLFAGYGRL